MQTKCNKLCVLCQWLALFAVAVVN